MNFLAHILLSGPHSDMQIGGFLGDFVKGPLRGDHPVRVEAGIRLHRRIDAYTDTLPTLRQLKLELPPPWRRYGGIITDMLWDHFLAQQWDRHHDEALDRFCNRFYRELADYAQLPAQAQRLGQLGLSHPWLQNYADWRAVEQVLQRVGQRLRRPVPLELALADIAPRLKQHERAFDAIFPSLQAFAANERRLLSSHSPHRQ